MVTMRNRMLPQKVGIFVWRAKRKRIPVRDELSKRGIDLDSVLCPFGNVSFSSLEEMFESRKPSSQSPSKSFLWQGIEWTCYTIWRNRNLAIFQKKKGNCPMTLNEIQVKSFEWIARRLKASSLDWNQWLLNPLIQDDHG
ncbi:uncharacterized protein [Rutidosis leptorrhynchoides]|uniref:uncharacterized protein n=1 Tax=Rutidosis leptorrhynchoides TaxID=125765 RepID=UPI003A990ED5